MMIEWIKDAPFPASGDVSGVATTTGTILAAGQGVRLRPVTDNLAKPLVPILNVPLLFWAADAFRRTGLGRAVANVHTMAEQFAATATVLGSRHGFELELVHEARLSGPAGGLASCRTALTDAECHLVINGDAFTDLDLSEVVSAHIETGADLTIVGTTTLNPHRFGVLRLRGTRVVGMDEKPAAPPHDAVVSCGIYVLSTGALGMLDPSVALTYDFKHVVPMFLSSGLSVYIFRTEAYWSDVGTVDGFRDTNLWALASRAATRVALRTPTEDGFLWRQGTTHVSDGASIRQNVLVGRGALVRRGARLSNSVIGPGARIEANASVFDSVVMPGAVVRTGTVVESEVVL